MRTLSHLALRRFDLPLLETPINTNFRQSSTFNTDGVSRYRLFAEQVSQGTLPGPLQRAPCHPQRPRLQGTQGEVRSMYHMNLQIESGSVRVEFLELETTDDTGARMVQYATILTSVL